MAQRKIQLLRSRQIYTPTIQYVNINDDTDVKTPEQFAMLEPSEQENYRSVETKRALENAIASFNDPFASESGVQDGEIMLARYQETGGDVKSVLAAYTDKDNQKGFTFYVDGQAIMQSIDALSSHVDEVDKKNTLSAADDSVVVDTQSTGTSIGVNVDWQNEPILKLGNSGIYTDVNLVKVLPAGTESTGIVIDPTLSVNVREAYRLMSGSQQIGQQINVYKDSALTEIYLGSRFDSINAATGVITKYVWQLKNDPLTHITDAEYQTYDAQTKENYEPIDLQSLNYAYHLEDGTYTLVSVDISRFLAETEFGPGFSVVNGIVNLDIQGNVTVGEDVTYVAILKNNPDEMITQTEYDNLREFEQEDYYRYVSNNDPSDMLTKGEYNRLTPVEQSQYSPISINAVEDIEVPVFNTENGVVDVDAIQQAINYAAISAADGVRVYGSDSINVATGNVISVKLSDESDNAIEVIDSGNTGVYLSSTWDCGEY